jgi:alanyl-tRNA synthetase
VYVFSPDVETGKVAHVNYLPKEVLERKVLDAKSWLGEVSKVIGGKVSVTSLGNQPGLT